MFAKFNEIPAMTLQQNVTEGRRDARTDGQYENSIHVPSTHKVFRGYIYLGQFMRCSFLFDLILYVPSTIFQLNRDGYSLVEPVLS